MPRTIHFVGDTQARILSRLYARLIAPATGDAVRYHRQIAAPALPPPAADLLVAQIRTPTVPVQWLNDARVILFPHLECRHLWPFAHPVEQGYRDLYLDHDQSRPAVAYAHFAIETAVNLPVLAEQDRERHELLEALTGRRLATLKWEDANRQTFLAPHMPAPDIMAELAQVTFTAIGHTTSTMLLRAALADEFGDIFRELPVHPSVIRAFGLRYFDPEPIFATPGGNLTFEGFARCYRASSPPIDPCLATITEPLAGPIVDEAHRLITEGDKVAAESLLADAMAHLRDAPDIPELLTELMLARGAAETAATVAERAATLAPDRARNCRNLAAALFASGQTADALPAAQRAVALDAFDPQNRNLLAELLEALGRREDAIDTLERGRRLDACNDQSFSLLGNFWLRDGAHDLAAEAFAQGLALNPDRDDMRSGLAELRSA